MASISPTKTFIAGGNGPDLQLLDVAFIYDWESEQFIDVGPLPGGPRNNHMCGLSINPETEEPAIVVTGGVVAGGATKSTYFYNLETENWVSKT